MNLSQILEKAARSFPDKTAMVMGKHCVSYMELNDTAIKVANALRKIGVKKGDRIATIQSSNPEFVTIFLGIMRAGGIAVPLDPRYVVAELACLFDDCRPTVLVAEGPVIDALMPVLHRFSYIKHVISLDPEHEGRFSSYRQINNESTSSLPDVRTDLEDIAMISYNSGPTYHPRGVALSHGSISIEAFTAAELFEQDDVLVAFALPMYHQFGLVAALLAPFVKGSTIAVVPGTGRSIHNFLETVERERGTIYMGVPYVYTLMIEIARREGIRHDLSSLRLCISGGAAMEPEVMHRFKQYYGLDIIDAYGQTEAVCHITCAPIDGSGQPGSSGQPIPCWDIKIFDENDNELPIGREGEIVARGPVMTGFYRKPQATGEVLRNGWLHTGDLGRIDEDGYLFVTGRKRKMIVVKGQNVFPEDIEEVLTSHPEIASAKVVGVPDIIRGETVKAIIRPEVEATVTGEEIRKFCQDRLASHKLPRDIVFTGVLPETTSLWSRREERAPVQPALR